MAWSAFRFLRFFQLWVFPLGPWVNCSGSVRFKLQVILSVFSHPVWVSSFLVQSGRTRARSMKAYKTVWVCGKRVAIARKQANSENGVYVFL